MGGGESDLLRISSKAVEKIDLLGKQGFQSTSINCMLNMHVQQEDL
jgi:hypothetical protein